MSIFWQVFLVIYFLGLFYSAYHFLFVQDLKWTWRFAIVMFFTWILWPVGIPFIYWVDDKLNG